MEDSRALRTLARTGEVGDQPRQHSDFALHVLLRKSDGREECRQFLKVVRAETGVEALVLFIVDTEIGDIYPVAGEGEDAPRIFDQMAGWKTDLLNEVQPSGGVALSEEVSRNVHRFGDITFVLFATPTQHLGALGLLHQPQIEEQAWRPLFVSAVHLLLSIATSRTSRKLTFRGLELKRTRRRLEKAFRQNSSDKRMVENLVADLRNALKTAEAASQAKSEFLSRMSHELRTPLNAILGFSQLMISSDELIPRQREHIGHVLQAGTHLLDLINEVLELSAVESGALAVNPESLDVTALVKDCVELMRQLAGKAHITILDKVSNSGPILVNTDKMRLKQILINLVSNAIKYNETGGVVTLECTTFPDEIEISVADTGAGMHPRQLKKLFEPFGRLTSDKSYVEGTGLGLIISKQVIESLGGSLVVKSVVGEGSEFSIRLPIYMQE